MESLPDIKVAEYSESFTPSEQSLLEKLKESIQDEILQALGFLETASHSASANAEKPLLKDLKAYLLRLDELVSKVIPNSLLVQKTKKELDGLKSVILTTEKLAFLIRYFNWDNDENYNKFLTSRVPKAHSIIYSFNMHLQNLVKSIVQNIEPNNAALLQFVQHSSEPASFQFGSDFFSIKTPVVLSRAHRDPSSVILLEYYYLERAYNALKEILTITAPEQVKTKTKQSFKRLAGAPEHQVENSKKSATGSLKDFMNIDEIVGLEKELENVEDLKDNEQILKYLFASKKRLDELVNQAKEKLSGPVEKPSSLRSVKADSPSNTQKQEGSLPLEKVDDILSTEIKGYNAQAGKTMKAYWQELSEEIRQEVIRMVSLDKFLLQSVYLSIYFEQRYVVFYSSSTHFVNENFAKLIEDFCYTANKEYKSMPAVTNQQGVHPLYYCYVAENKQDFYLVEYHPNSPLLRVYMTAAPMLATLHKHLAKLDITKIAKKSFHVTRLNFYDSEVGIELRNLLINSKLKKEDDSDEEDEYGISRNFRYFIFITIFLINNSSILASDFEVSFTTKDLITFYNYLAEYQNISLKNQEENQPIPDIFDFCYPFVNLRDQREAYLLFNKKDSAKDLSILSIKNQYTISKDLPNFVPLNFEEDINSQATLRHEILEYLRRNKDKSTFNFDGSTYILDYLKRNFQSQLDASQSPGKAFQVFSKEQTQKLLEIFVSGAKDHELLKNLASCSTAAKVCMLFSGRPESMGLLMISYERKRRRCTAYLWDSKEGRDEQALGEFVEYIRELMQEENKEVNETIDSRFVYCKPNDELITHYFRHHYFPFTCLIDRDAVNTKESAVTLGAEDLVDPFKYFLSVNIAENNLELFKVYSKMLEEKMFQQWEIANVATMWKFSELKYTLQVLSEKLVEESIENILISFSFLGAMGSKVYYLYLREQQSPNASTEELTYLVDLYSLTYNLDLDDQEIIALVYQCCKLSPRVKLILNAAYQINPTNNILLYTQVEITLTTLGYLVHFCNFAMEKAFQKIAQSVVVHYEILEELMSHSEGSAKTKGGARHQETAPIKMELAPESPQREFNEQGVKFKVYQSYFEELLKENQYKKKIESEVPDLLKVTALDSGDDPEAMDIASFLNQLNCEVTPPLTYFFATNELFTKRVISNENNILTDKSVYAFLIKELTSSKAKYEEALELRYQQTSIYFILPINLMQTHQIPIVNYNVESHKITYYFIHSQNKPKLQENIFSFIESLSVKLASGSTQTMKAASSRELKVNACPIVLADDVLKILETQYPLIVKALIRLSSRRDIMREEKILLNMERLNNFMCEYAEDLFTQNIEVSKVKENYRYLSNLFLQKDSPLTKNIALLTFLNGTASIEQLGVINNCIKSFKDDFDKIAGIEHAFFGFNVSVKNSIKHYLLHLTAHENGGSTLRLFTNLLGDADNVIDRMIQSYCVDQQEENQDDKRKVEQLLLFKINIPNTIFARYLEISSLLIANAVCNGISDSNEYCAKLALSPIHYFDELKHFEEKCEQLNLFQDVSSETQV